jgi:hypothetical protein
MSIALIYRDVGVGLRARLEALMRARAGEVSAAPQALAQTYALRKARFADWRCLSRQRCC